MKIRNSIGLVLALLMLVFPAFLKAQDLKKKYDQAEILINNNQYVLALPLFLSIDSAQADNNNV